MKRNRRAALALFGATAMLLTGCTGEVDNQDSTPFRGFERVGEVGEYGVWYDRGAETGLSNVIIADGTHRLVSCLGEPVLICYDSNREGGQLILVIAAEETESVTVDFAGEDVELELMGEPENEDDTPPVFAGQAPPFDGENFSWSFYGYGADGEELWTR